MSVSTITPWVIGNWKMNPVQAEALSLVRDIKNLLETAPIAEDQCHLGVAPIAIALSSDSGRAVICGSSNLYRSTRCFTYFRNGRLHR